MLKPGTMAGGGSSGTVGRSRPLATLIPAGRRMFYQIISIAGAALILAAYAANQRGWTGPGSTSYNVMNLLGALLLLWVAIVDRRLGFIFLEVVWAAVTIPPLYRSLRSLRDAGT